MSIEQLVQWLMVWTAYDEMLATSFLILTATALSLAADGCAKFVGGKHFIGDAARVAMWWISFAAISIIAYRI